MKITDTRIWHLNYQWWWIWILTLLLSYTSNSHKNDNWKPMTVENEVRDKTLPRGDWSSELQNIFHFYCTCTCITSFCNNRAPLEHRHPVDDLSARYWHCYVSLADLWMNWSVAYLVCSQHWILSQTTCRSVMELHGAPRWIPFR